MCICTKCKLYAFTCASCVLHVYMYMCLLCLLYVFSCGPCHSCTKCTWYSSYMYVVHVIHVVFLQRITWLHLPAIFMITRSHTLPHSQCLLITHLKETMYTKHMAEALVVALYIRTARVA